VNRRALNLAAFNARLNGIDNLELREGSLFEPVADERFDLVLCFGILHRVENPIGLLRLLGGRLAADGCILVETYGVPGDRGAAEGALYVPRPGELYPGDDFAYWQFSSGALSRLAVFADLPHFQLCCTPMVDGHPRILGRIGAEPFAVPNLVG